MWLVYLCAGSCAATFPTARISADEMQMVAHVKKMTLINQNQHWALIQLLATTPPLQRGVILAVRCPSNRCRQIIEFSCRPRVTVAVSVAPRGVDGENRRRSGVISTCSGERRRKATQGWEWQPLLPTQHERLSEMSTGSRRSKPRTFSITVSGEKSSFFSDGTCSGDSFKRDSGNGANTLSWAGVGGSRTARAMVKRYSARCRDGSPSARGVPGGAGFLPRAVSGFGGCGLASIGLPGSTEEQ